MFLHDGKHQRSCNSLSLGQSKETHLHLNNYLIANIDRATYYYYNYVDYNYVGKFTTGTILLSQIPHD